MSHAPNFYSNKNAYLSANWNFMIWCPTVMSVMSGRVAWAKKKVYGKIRVDKGRTDLANKQKKTLQYWSGHFLCLSHDWTWISDVICLQCLGPFFVLSELRWVVTVHFVDIGGIIDRHCLNFLFIIIRGDCSFCWYWRNCWLLLFKLSFHKKTILGKHRFRKITEDKKRTAFKRTREKKL